MTQQTPATNTSQIHFGKTLLALCGLGLPGILSLIPLIMSQVDVLPPELAEMPQIYIGMIGTWIVMGAFAIGLTVSFFRNLEDKQ